MRADVLGQVGESSGRIHLSVHGTCKPRAISEMVSNLGPFSAPSMCPPFYFQVCRPSPFQHLLSVMHSRMWLFAFFISSGHWPFTSICVPGSGDLGSWTEAPWRGEVLSTEKPSGYFHYFWQSLWTCTYGPSPSAASWPPHHTPRPRYSCSKVGHVYAYRTLVCFHT